VRSFREIIEGKHDDLPERAFLLKGTIDDVVEAARGARDEEEQPAASEDEAEDGEPEADENGDGSQ
jgi:hypothetical protein